MIIVNVVQPVKCEGCQKERATKLVREKKGAPPDLLCELCFGRYGADEIAGFLRTFGAPLKVKRYTMRIVRQMYESLEVEVLVPVSDEESEENLATDLAMEKAEDPKADWYSRDDEQVEVDQVGEEETV